MGCQELGLLAIHMASMTWLNLRTGMRLCS